MISSDRGEGEIKEMETFYFACLACQKKWDMLSMLSWFETFRNSSRPAGGTMQSRGY